MNDIKQNPNIHSPDGINEGAILHVKGKIEKDNNFPIYTHSISFDKGPKIGLMGGNINLNNFSGEYTFIGYINNIRFGIPSIHVMYIQDVDNNVLIEDSQSFYLDQGIIIDSKNLVNIRSQINGESIDVYSDDIIVLSIDSEVCNDSDSENHCNEFLIDSQRRFLNSNLHTFYNIGENNRLVLNANNMGYIISGQNDDVVIDYSSIIDFLDTSWFVDQYRGQIFDMCIDLDLILDVNISREGMEYVMELSGVTDDNTRIGCKININLRDKKGITNVSLF